MMGITSLRAWLKAIYSHSVVERPCKVCNFDPHVTRQFANLMAYPVRDFDVLSSFCAVNLFQFPLKFRVRVRVDCLCVRFLGIRAEPCTLVHCVADVGSCALF